MEGSVGTVIIVNKGPQETLVKIQDGLGLFVCPMCKVVRQLNRILEKEIVFVPQEFKTKLF